MSFRYYEGVDQESRSALVIEQRGIWSADWPVDIWTKKGRCQAPTLQPKAQRLKDHSEQSTFSSGEQEESCCRPGTAKGEGGKSA